MFEGCQNGQRFVEGKNCVKVITFAPKRWFSSKNPWRPNQEDDLPKIRVCMLVFDNNPLPNMFFHKEYIIKNYYWTPWVLENHIENALATPIIASLLSAILLLSFANPWTSKKNYDNQEHKNIYIYNMGRYSKHPNKKPMALWNLLHLMPKKLIASLPPLFCHLPTLEFSWLLTLVLHHTFANCTSMPLNS